VSRLPPSPAGGGGPGRRLRALLLVAGLVPASGSLAQDGRAVFERSCAACHAIERGASPMAGPNLAGLAGRRVGGDPGFGYSPALEQAGRDGDAWDAARLARFLADPEEMYPGLWMGANGLPDAAERDAVAAFLAR
jgi:cytochrome c2